MEELTVSVAAASCQCSRSAISRWVTSGCEGVRLKARFVGGKWLIRADDLEAFINTLTAKHLGTDGEAKAPKKRQPKSSSRAKARLKSRGVPIKA